MDEAPSMPIMRDPTNQTGINVDLNWKYKIRGFKSDFSKITDIITRDLTDQTGINVDLSWEHKIRWFRSDFSKITGIITRDLTNQAAIRVDLSWKYKIRWFRPDFSKITDIIEQSEVHRIDSIAQCKLQAMEYKFELQVQAYLRYLVSEISWQAIFSTNAEKSIGRPRKWSKHSHCWHGTIYRSWKWLVNSLIIV